MNGKERILKALTLQQPDRVPFYIHGINEAPIIGIGKHLPDGLPEPRQFHEMTDGEKMKLGGCPRMAIFRPAIDRRDLTT